MIKSKAILKDGANFNFGSEILIDNIDIAPIHFENIYNNQKKLFPNKSEDEIKYSTEQILTNEKIITKIFDYLIPMFDFTIEKEEFLSNYEKFKKYSKNPHPNKKQNLVIINYIERIFKQQMIIDYFVQYYNPELLPSDEEIKKKIDVFKNLTGKNINTFDNENGILIAKETICQQNFVDWIKNKYKIKISTGNHLNS
ncbi:MAG: hypothetical protein ACRCW6_01430 [Mycoplasmoidaceae bacterium]